MRIYLITNDFEICLIIADNKKEALKRFFLKNEIANYKNLRIENYKVVRHYLKCYA